MEEKIKKESKPKKSKKDLRKEIYFVLDRSGSMTTKFMDVIGGFKTYLESETQEEKNSKVQTFLTLIQFNTDVKVDYSSSPIKEVKPLDGKTFCPEGLTALYDSVGVAIRNAEAKGHDKKEAVLFVIFTDGQENSSKEFTRESIKALREQKEKDGWSFVFMGIGQESWAGSEDMGFGAANTVKVAGGQSAQAFDNLTRSSRIHTQTYANTGQTQTKNFFVPEDEKVS